MEKISFPYGTGTLEAIIPKARLQAILTNELYTQKSEKSPSEIIKNALENPIGTPKLREMAIGCKNVVIIISDQTRAVPSKEILPLMLKEIRTGNPEANITLLVAMGTHRKIRPDELRNKLGDIMDEEQIVIHDCDDTDNLVRIGVLPSGGDLYINRLAAEADLLCSEGLIEPHFFAGFSGGRKSVLPGIASRDSIKANHCSANIADPGARTGITEHNPVHDDMLYAARKARLDFILNVIINSDKNVVHAVAGDVGLAHARGVQMLIEQRRVEAAPADIVITSNGGYPLDQNVYQAVKCMTTAEETVREGGVIIVMAKSNDGVGGEDFYRFFRDEADIDKTLDCFLNTSKSETPPEQWQAQILIRVLKKAKVIYISDLPNEIAQNFYMIPAKTVEEAIKIADELLGYEGKITVIPNGTSVMVE